MFTVIFKIENQKSSGQLTNNTAAATTTTNSNNNNVNSNNHHWHDESNSGWTSTGVMSDRSSVYSIDDGDFDREASRKVTNQLKEIESILYERNSSLTSNYTECKEWLEKFPHIRILGQQIFSNGNGLASTLDFDSTSVNGRHHHGHSHSHQLQQSIQFSTRNTGKKESEFTHSYDLRSAAAGDPSSRYARRREASDLAATNLHVNGSSMPIRKVGEKSLNENHDEYLFLEEEIIDQEGVYEELLAYDNQEEENLYDNNKRLNLNKRRRHGLPPITPKASMRDLVAYFLFDQLWSDLIDWSSQTIKSYAKAVSNDFVADDTNNNNTNSNKSQPNNPNHHHLTYTRDETSLTLTTNTNELFKSLLNSSTNNFNLLTKSNDFQQSSLFTTDLNGSKMTSTTATVNNNSSSQPQLFWTKPNIVQLKPFDNSHTTTNNNTNTQQPSKQHFHDFYTNESKSNALTPSLLSRDNSTLYAQSTSKYNNNENSNNFDLNDCGMFDLLKIKQLQKNGTTKT